MKHHVTSIWGIPLFRTFSKFLNTFPIGPNDKIVIAVSGGPDSVCLLYLLWEYFKHISKPTQTEAEQKYAVDRLHVAHLNHSFRPEADEEATFVADLCQSWGIASTVTKLPVPMICKEKRLSKQEGARLVRYAFLTDVAKAQQARWIALGHTADDHVETFLMNLLRGTGGDGLSGIPRIREEMIIRPLLDMTRNEIVALLRKNNIPFRQDPSNQDKRYLRNRVRHDLIPILETYNPNIKKTFLRTASVLTDETDFFNHYIKSLVKEVTLRITKNEVVFDLTLFCALHKAIQRRLIRYGIRHLQGDLRGIGFDYIEAILKIVQGAHSKSFLLPYLSVKKTGATLALTCNNPVGAIGPVTIVDLDIPQCTLKNLTSEITKISLQQWKISLSLSLKNRSAIPFPSKTEDCSAFFDFDTIAYPLTVRRLRTGDHFAPLGMQGRHKKLQDFFVDRKIDKTLRNQIPILSCPKGIIWVIGYRTDERFKVTEETQQILSLHIEKGT